MTSVNPMGFSVARSAGRIGSPEDRVRDHPGRVGRWPAGHDPRHGLAGRAAPTPGTPDRAARPDPRRPTPATDADADPDADADRPRRRPRRRRHPTADDRRRPRTPDTDAARSRSSRRWGSSSRSGSRRSSRSRTRPSRSVQPAVGRAAHLRAAGSHRPARRRPRRSAALHRGRPRQPVLPGHSTSRSRRRTAFEPIGLIKADVAIEYGRPTDPAGIKHKDISFRPDGRARSGRPRSSSTPSATSTTSLTLQYHFDRCPGWDGEQLSYELPTVTSLDRTLLVNPFRDFGFSTSGWCPATSTPT